ncbi:alpha/beta fold hydrolase [Hoeflea poritis]|uniref:Alpha/beta hydrolase n=1 Tax=Hoeflea poritis TaxID=2993659 RepID=A0ABT4VVM4_9HYPH|nr:alpha/beta hydrolase [Hoeflea poritis]MDA4848235.1 alpha/beta hydrolase [Hoeflea poritis]
MEFRSATFEDDIRHIHYVSAGDASKPLMLCLHGFPEYWGGWRDIMPFLAQTHHVVAPDQRGFGKSFKPEGEDAYQTRHLVADMAALADHLSPDTPFALFGHDWGSAVAYSFAFSRPERLSALIVANGVHPHCFQKAIIEDPQQRAASQYMTFLRSDRAEAVMCENDFARTMNMISGFSAAGWMSEAVKADYRAAWSGEGTMRAMLNWYRSSPVLVPPVEQPVSELEGRVPVYAIPAEALRVEVPHLVVWGDADEALRPSCLEGLDRFAADLTIEKVPGTGHWILHERPQQVSQIAGQWLARLERRP